LPLITVPEQVQVQPLFYYYRQYKLDKQSEISLLLFPAESLAQRTSSFELLEYLTPGVSAKPDPRSRQRAWKITDLAVAPFLSSYFASDDQEQSGEIGLVDIGGGTGSLASNICKRLLASSPDMLSNRKFACSIVDLRLQEPSRYFRRGQLRKNVSYLTYEQADYIDWLQDQDIVPGKWRFDVALACRLFNNLSDFGIGSTDSWHTVKKIGGKTLRKADWINRYYDPPRCLKSDAEGQGRIICSNSHVTLENGKTFRQLSLSKYYQGLHQLSELNETVHSTQETYFPLRQFNPDCLIMATGQSVFGRLCEIAKVVVIEDVDLSSQNLRDHLRKLGLTQLAASEVSGPIQKQSARLFCLCRKELLPHLPGERIW
jgi:hypothetical protein